MSDYRPFLLSLFLTAALVALLFPLLSGIENQFLLLFPLAGLLVGLLVGGIFYEKKKALQPILGVVAAYMLLFVFFVVTQLYWGAGPKAIVAAFALLAFGVPSLVMSIIGVAFMMFLKSRFSSKFHS